MNTLLEWIAVVLLVVVWVSVSFWLATDDDMPEA
jgi:hypothetical protein